MTHAHERMSAVDAAWLRMDATTQRMMITTVFRFAEPVAFEELERLVRERVLVNPRFRQKAVESTLHLGTPEWVLDRHFDLRSHLHKVALPSPHDQAALADLVSDLASTPFDRDKPLWQMHYVEGYFEGPVLVTRLHHAIGDGVSLVHFLLSLTDECEDSSPQSVGLELPDRPRGSVELAKIAAEHAAALGRMLLMPTDPQTVFRGKLGRSKRVAWTRPIPASELKRVGKSVGAKLNDVLLALAAGAARRYLLPRTRVGDELELRALVPVFFRGHGVDADLGNHFGLVFAPLLVAIEDPRERVMVTKQRMDQVKSAPDAMVALEVLALMGAASAEIETVGIDIFTRKASFMITNVPGPPMGLHLAGRALADLLVWAPVAGHIGTGISLVTYAGQVRIGIAADAGLVPDPFELAKAFEAEVEALLGGPIDAQAADGSVR